jgi:hypothetical protein
VEEIVVREAGKHEARKQGTRKENAETQRRGEQHGEKANRHETWKNRDEI